MNEPEEKLPREFGKYHLIERVATGGMAELYRAKLYGAGGFEKDLAVKKILPSLGGDQGFVQMFMDEAMITATLNHGNIAQVIDFGEFHGEYFLVMEYVYGIDLQALIKRATEHHEPIPVNLAAYIVAEVCNGLEYAHNKLGPDGQPLQIVHRDVSPQNVLISFEGQVKLVDFGIARAASRITSTQVGVVKGKVYYMSPEQLTGQALDARSDVFAAGIILYQVLTHQRPFEGATPQETMALVSRGSYQAPQKLNRRVDRKLAQVIKKALDRNVKRRYQSAGKMAAELASYLHNTGEPPTAMTLARLVRERLPEARPHTMLADPVHAMRRDPTPGGRPAGMEPKQKITTPDLSDAVPHEQESSTASPDPEKREPEQGDDAAVLFKDLGLPEDYMLEVLDSELRKKSDLPEPKAADRAQVEEPEREDEDDSELLFAAAQLLTQTNIGQYGEEESSGEQEVLLPDAKAPTPPRSEVEAADELDTLPDFADEAPESARKTGKRWLVILTLVLVVAAAAVVFFMFANPLEKESTDRPDRAAPTGPASLKASQPPPGIPPLKSPLPDTGPDVEPDVEHDLVPVAKPGKKMALRPRGTGTLKINSEPFSVVFWGKKRIGATPQMNVKLPAGSHTLLLKNDALGIQKRVRVRIEANKVQTVFVKLKK